MTIRLKIDGVTCTLPESCELLHDEDGELYVREDDGECFQLDHYYVRSTAF